MNGDKCFLNIGDCSLGLYEKALSFAWDWDRKLKTVKGLGFDFMEFSVDPDHIDRLDWTEDEIASFRETSVRLGVPVHTLALSANREYPLGSRDDIKRESGKTLLRKAVALAVKLGVRIIQVAAYDEYDGESDDETDRLFLDSLKECAHTAARSGVMFALETMDKPYANSIERCKRIVDIISSPWVQIYADTGNIAAAGVEFTKDIEAGAHHVVAVHLKDSMPGVVRRVDYGAGIVDFGADLLALKQKGFSGFFVAEMWWDDDPGYLKKVEDACRFLREKIKIADLTEQ